MAITGTTFRLRKLGHLGIGGVAVLLIAAPIWLTFFDTLQKAYAPYKEAAHAYQIQPGLLIGRIPLSHDGEGRPGRTGLTFGAGEQIALTHFHTYNHGLVVTVRMPF